MKYETKLRLDGKHLEFGVLLVQAVPSTGRSDQVTDGLLATQDEVDVPLEQQEHSPGFFRRGFRGIRLFLTTDERVFRKMQ